MLIITDSNELGDKRLNPEEALAKFKLENADMVRHLKLSDQEELKNVEKAMGQPLSYQEVCRRLKLVNPQLIVKDGGVRGAIQVRIPCNDPDEESGTRYVTGFYKDVLPEYSYVLVNERDLPVREVRGWRQVTAQLIKMKLTTWEVVEKVFGAALGQRSEHYYEHFKEQDKR